MKEWSPCEIEAYFVNKGIQKHEHFLKICGQPGIVLVDSKPVSQAKLRLDSGQFSTNHRLQELLANLSSKRMTLQHISAKLPSPLLAMVDFASRHPVTCSIDSCTICHEHPDCEIAITRLTSTEPSIHLASLNVGETFNNPAPIYSTLMPYLSLVGIYQRKKRMC